MTSQSCKWYLLWFTKKWSYQLIVCTKTLSCVRSIIVYFVNGNFISCFKTCPVSCDYDCYFEIQGLGKLAEKFPNIASTSIYCLRDFLVTPSPILFKLHRQQCESAAKDGQKLKITGKLSFSLMFLLHIRTWKNIRTVDNTLRNHETQFLPCNHMEEFPY